MKHILENGKVVNISDKEIQNYMTKLDLSKQEAIDLWLEENDYQENEELNEPDDKAKKVKINHGVANEKPKEKKPHTVKVSDEKTEIFERLTEFLRENYEFSVEKNNKMFKIFKNGKEFKLDLIQTREKKKNN